jgi:NitT/TauT family transport system permease protein/taurine transport system permease protein
MQHVNMSKWLIGLASLGGLFLLWHLATVHFGWVSPARFPTPTEVEEALLQITEFGYGNGLLHQHVLHSLKLVALGFTVAVVIGVTLGLIMGHSKAAEDFINPTFLLIRPIPPLAWIPLAIVWLGLEDASKTLVIFMAAFVPSVINTYTGVKAIEKPILEASRMLNIRGWEYVRSVLLPGAAPYIFTGLRLSLQASWTTLVAAELIGALYGLGSILNQASQDIYPAMILVAMVAVGICGALTTWVLGFIESRAMPWNRDRRTV